MRLNGVISSDFLVLNSILLVDCALACQLARLRILSFLDLFFLFWNLCVFILICGCSLHIQDMNPGSVLWVANISSQAGVCLCLSLASIIMLRLIAFKGRSVRLFL